jgi:hypothetical protein
MEKWERRVGHEKYFLDKVDIKSGRRT